MRLSTAPLIDASSWFERLCDLANAIMRRLTHDGETLLAVTHEVENLPDWLRRNWQHYWGDAATNTTTDGHVSPTLDVSVAKDTAEWAKSLMDICLMARLSAENLTRSQDCRRAWWVQDAAAAMPTRLLASLMANR